MKEIKVDTPFSPFMPILKTKQRSFAPVAISKKKLMQLLTKQQIEH